MEDGSEDGEDGNKKRRKRAATTSTPKRASSKKLRKTNSASSVLGLNILLYQNQEDYYKPPSWKGLVQNSYVGFKVRWLTLM